MTKFKKCIAFVLSIIFIVSTPFSAFALDSQEEATLISTHEIYDNEGNPYIIEIERVDDVSKGLVPYSNDYSENVDHVRYSIRMGGDGHVYLDPADTGYIATVDLYSHHTCREDNGISDYFKLLTAVEWSWTILDSSFVVDSAEVFYCCKQSYSNTINVANRPSDIHYTGFSVYGDAYNEAIGSYISIIWRNGTRRVESTLVSNVGGSLTIGGRY